MSYAHVLRNVSLFAQINDDELDALASNLSSQSFHKNQILFQQGSTTSSLYIVKNGRVQITVYGRNNETTYIGVYGPDQCFGEFSLLDGLPRSGKAVAITNTDLLVLTRPIFFRFLEQHPTVAIKLLVTVSRRLRFAESAVDHPKLLRPEQIVARTLTEIAEHYSVTTDRWIHLNLHLTGDDLASLAGVNRDMANAILNQFRADGLITLERSHIDCIDILRLRELTQSSEAQTAKVGDSTLE